MFCSDKTSVCLFLQPMNAQKELFTFTSETLTMQRLCCSTVIIKLAENNLSETQYSTSKPGVTMDNKKIVMGTELGSDSLAFIN